MLVVEAAARSGALITARLASEYNREVFVIPGRIDSPLAQGTNDLIKKGGAKLVMGLEDILEELGEAGRCLMPEPSAAPNPATTGASAVRLNDDENAVLTAIADEPLSIEVICDTLGLPPAKVAVALTGLQLKGAVQRTAGDIYSARNPLRA